MMEMAVLAMIQAGSFPVRKRIQASQKVAKRPARVRTRRMSEWRSWAKAVRAIVSRISARVRY
jgi:hypothetical protein